MFSCKLCLNVCTLIKYLLSVVLKCNVFKTGPGRPVEPVRPVHPGRFSPQNRSNIRPAVGPAGLVYGRAGFKLLHG
ncbi:hypothetical protein HanRHA438_Chr09g0375291 [Helianthus annuus]|nr:hypothetical protein HanRHA438_Chr09g0375291 [Helianthus annuus]